MIHRKCVSVVVALLTILLVASAQNISAQDSPASVQALSNFSNSAKIAFVGMQQVIATCDEGRDETARFQQWAEKRRSELQVLQKEIDALKSQLEVQGAKLTDEARNELADKIDAKETSLQRSQQDSQKEADKLQQRATEVIYKKAVAVIDKLANDRNLDCVFFLDQNRDGYIKPSLIITDEVVKAYNAAYPVNAAQKQ